MEEFKTPMMQQYASIKQQHPDCILFFRLGDFYEMFLKDAEIGSEVMGLTLTARNKGQDGKIPMCGLPYHALDSYLPKMIEAGYKVAICEQTSNPEESKGIVDRAVVKIITKGTLIEESMIDRKSNNYILSFKTSLEKNTDLSISYADISTGEFYVKSIPLGDYPENIIKESIAKINPQEIVLDEKDYNDHKFINILQGLDAINISRHNPIEFKSKSKIELIIKSILKFFNLVTIESLSIDKDNYDLLQTIMVLISYITYTQKQDVSIFKTIKDLTNISFMKLEASTIRNLEIFDSNQLNGTNLSNLFLTSQNVKGIKRIKNLSLYSTIDKTLTAMGGRLLKNRLMYPSINKEEIDKRLNSVEILIKQNKTKFELEEYIKQISDIQRLMSKIDLVNCNARDLLGLIVAIKNSIEVVNIMTQIPQLSYIFDRYTNVNIKDTLEELINLTTYLNKTLKEDPPVTIHNGRMINNGVNQELDDLKDSIRESQEWIAELEGKERLRTGISKLKVGYTSVFGYYIEISKININKVPPEYIRKQTLVTSERYITDELKYKEEIVLNAQDKINELEYKIFINIVNDIKNHSHRIQWLSNIIAEIDVINSFATKAVESNYTKPSILNISDYKLEIKEGRHPIVESVLNTGEFTPNDTLFSDCSCFHIITGPNMAGKSTYIRQIALIQLMAQIGSYVPAYTAEISIVVPYTRE